MAAQPGGITRGCTQLVRRLAAVTIAVAFLAATALATARTSAQTPFPAAATPSPAIASPPPPPAVSSRTPASTAVASPMTRPAASVTPVGVRSPTAASPVPPAGGGSTGQIEITPNDNGKTFQIAVGQTILVRLGTELDWTVTFDPPGILRAVPGVGALVRGVQALVRGEQPGTVTIQAQGKPICNPGQACPLFIAVFKATVVVSSAQTGGGTVSQQPSAAPPLGATTNTGGPVRTASQPASAPAAAPQAGAIQGRPADVALPNTGTGGQTGAPQWDIRLAGVLLLAVALAAAAVQATTGSRERR